MEPWDDRGQSIQVGAVLIFAALTFLLSPYRSTVVSRSGGENPASVADRDGDGTPEIVYGDSSGAQRLARADSADGTVSHPLRRRRGTRGGQPRRVLTRLRGDHSVSVRDRGSTDVDILVDRHL